ncbi:outer membrane beta-barrel protein [Aequorivita viscosa]|uniref:Outer membrane receptor proteins, mostly Fe transport n=1 Tax=Aequorivita viscosa TaxID=797419 RepID=A0A1M6EIP0_9FLAO|nr:outer membrane beta-barrel protein [Aequorivita viscosa]SDW02384.1 Outer membrane receptor proteins, mostly Fe transport [Aequorivita viscosa]SHI85299.1 Outer membrane receptor proteins, mostly Fe transport [Aequorivita viscosa]
MRLLFSLLILLSTAGVLAQQSEKKQVTIKGKILEDGTNHPLEYATVSFTDASGKIVTGGITDTEGLYNIKVPAGVYTVKYEFISYKTKTLPDQNLTSNTTLPTISLAMDSASLDEVVIRAETTEVQIRLDKKIYNIGKDLTSGGATVSDALSNVPSVTVDVDGAIALRGNENVKILINGKPSAIAGFGSTDALRQLPAEAIERVEVITSPSARYDAEGTAGILNIILKKEKTLGLNGSISTSIGVPLNSSTSGNINIRTDKFNLFNTTGIYYRKAPGHAKFDNRYFSRSFVDDSGQTITIDPPFDNIYEDRTYDRERKGFNTNLGMEYFLTDRSSITGSVFYRASKSEDVTENNTFRYQNNLLSDQSLRIENEDEDDTTIQFALNYENRFNDKGHKLTADLQFEDSKENEQALIRDFKKIPTNELLPKELINTDETGREYLAQVDYVLPIGENAQFEAGYRGDFNETTTDYMLQNEVGNSGNYVRNDSLSNKFNYEQNVNAIYSQYGNKFGKFSFLLGLRLENTVMKGKLDAEDVTASTSLNLNFDKNYTGLFPTVNLTYEIKESENITLGYNRRINRPRRWYLNPFPSRSSETNIFQGNPGLDPAYASAFDLGYLKRWKKLTLTASIYYQHETDSFERIQEETGEQTQNGVSIIRSLPINLSTNQRYGFEVGLLYNPFKWLNLNGSFNYFQFKTEGFYNDIDYGAENTSYFGRFSSKVKLPLKIEWQTNAFYRGPSNNAQTESDPILSVDMAMSKDIINDNATISLNASDLFNTRKRNSITTTNTFTSESEFQWRARTVTLTFSYRFNQSKQRQRGQRGGGMDDNGGYEG